MCCLLVCGIVLIHKWLPPIKTQHNAVSSYRIFTQLINRSINKSEIVRDFKC